jgi:hypothetical protein
MFISELEIIAAVPILSAITFIAYWHPKVYLKLYIILSIGLTSAYLLLIIYEVGKMHGSMEFIEFANDIIQDLENRRKLLDYYDKEDNFVMTTVAFHVKFWAILLYINFLLYLPSLFDEKDNKMD